MNEPSVIQSLLAEPRSIAVVGLSADPTKPSHYVSAYMQQKGFKVYPVNPSVTEVLGEQAYPSLTALSEAGHKPDVVNVFRTPNFIPAIVDEMLSLNLRTLWVQQGILHRDAAETAEAGGMQVVMDRCIMVEHRRVAGSGPSR